MSTGSEQIYRRQKAGLAWLAAYLVTTGVIVWSVYALRARAMENLTTPEARAAWEEWRQAAADQTTGGPVQRKPPESPEPPALVLLRDHFGVMLSSAIVFGSVLFGIFMVFIRGVLSPNLPPVD
jgi:hypothetical protein